MRPATTYVMRSTGCGRFLGVVLIAIGLLVLLANSNLVVPSRISRWWPILIVALGLYLLARHYWRRFSRRQTVPAILENGLPTFSKRTNSLAPPGLPVVVIAVGLWRLAVNLHWTSSWVIVAIVLIAVGALFLGGSIRASLDRT